MTERAHQLRVLMPKDCEVLGLIFNALRDFGR
jgi:hypothetical protein